MKFAFSMQVLAYSRKLVCNWKCIAVTQCEGVRE
jgi:hypothetical protein